MIGSSDFLNRFDDVGRFRDGEGSVDAVFLTNEGVRLAGTLDFKDGLCVKVNLEGSNNWAFPDGSPLNGLKLLLHFEGEEPLTVFLERGRVLTLEMAQAGAPLEAEYPNVSVGPRARSTLESMPQKVQQEVIHAVVNLAKSPPPEWPREIVTQLGSDRHVYLLRIPSEWRAFIRATDNGRVEIFDIVREGTLRQFLERPKRSPQHNEAI